jgi:hypothetical protein
MHHVGRRMYNAQRSGTGDAVPRADKTRQQRK